LIIIGGFIGFINIEPEVASAYTPHNPILIDDSSDFTTPSSGFGCECVTGGSGAPSDPYIIEGWEIDATSVTGIKIQNTNTNFIIRDTYVHSGGPDCNGVSLQNVTNGRIDNTTLIDNFNGIYLDSAANISIMRNNISDNNYDGVRIIFSTNITIAYNDINSTNYLGININLSGGNITILGNNVSTNMIGIAIYQSNNMRISGNNLSFNSEGILLHTVSNGTVSNNVVKDNGIGIHAFTSQNITNSNNTISSNINEGVRISLSTNTTVSENNLSSDGILIYGDSLPHFNSHTISTDNQVNGKPLYYYKNCDGLDINSIQVGQLIIVNCTNLRIANLQITDTDTGLRMAFVEGALVVGNNISADNWHGILIHYSETINFTGNTVQFSDQTAVTFSSSTNVSVALNNLSLNGRNGISISDSNNTTIAGNNISNNNDAIYISSSKDITILGNNISSNDDGFVVFSSSNLLVYHNNLINNAGQAYDDGGNENAWDVGYPSGGNYWSNYVGVDNCSGPSQNICPDSDGIGDTPYLIDGNSKDDYPLMDTFFGDIRQPTVIMISPTDGEIFTTIPIAITGSASDFGGSGIDHVTVRINGGTWLNATGTSLWTVLANLSSGSNLLEARAWDGAGNPSSIIHIIVVYDSTDLISPYIEDVAVKPNPQEVYEHVNISANITDNNDVFGVWVNIKRPDTSTLGNFSMIYNSIDSRYSCNLTASVLGTFTFNIWANDTSGNWNNVSGEFNIEDNTAPIANAGVDKQIESGTNIFFSGIDSYDNFKIVNYTWEFIDISAIFLYGIDPTFEFNNLGNFEVTLTVTDSAGNFDTDIVWINVTENCAPNTPKNLTVTTPSAKGMLLLTWSANTEADLAGYNLYRTTNPDGTYVKINSDLLIDTNFTDTGLGDGVTYYYKIAAVDSANNESPQSEWTSGTTQVLSESVDGNFLWLLWLIPIIVVTIIIIFLWRRKNRNIE
jgi:parallel beta-helix repeat protein